ncbi:ankyrin repeat domain-containing protein [uncultured Legionella sp.]|uniref:ankyrin repeat domain-containing protein n=1 Tax=uncultured Legionella sp. TaxID=210934 RepID=UPI00262DA86D|nr:ankyrin repeat domain-containing protein [uncultured Legionella sp.]
MKGKNDKILQPIQSLETNIEENLSREEIEPLLNKYALEGQFATLYRLITKIYDRKQIAKICGYDSPRYSDSLNNYFRCDALIWAIAFGHANVVTNYLDINSLEPSILELAFYLAVIKKQALIVELLLDDDRLDVTNMESFNDCFSIAIRLNDLATIRCLLQDDRLKLNTGKGFVLACGLGHVELVNLFNPSRCIQRKTIDDLQTGWQIALKYKQMEVLKILLENDSIDPNKVLLEASKIGYSELVEYLLKNNRQINPGTQRSRSLHFAIEYGHLKVVQLLLDDGRAQPQALGNMAIRIATEKGGVKSYVVY